VDEKDIVPKSQAGFRKGRSTIDNIDTKSFNAERKGKEERMERYTYCLRT